MWVGGWPRSIRCTARLHGLILHQLNMDWFGCWKRNMKRSLQGGLCFLLCCFCIFRAIQLYVVGVMSDRQTPAVSRRYGGCKRSRSSVYSSECGCEVFLSISLLLGVYDGDKRTCWRAILTDKRKTESFLCWSLSGRSLSLSLGARSRSIGRGRAVAKCKQWNYCCVLDEVFHSSTAFSLESSAGLLGQAHARRGLALYLQ